MVEAKTSPRERRDAGSMLEELAQLLKSAESVWINIKLCTCVGTVTSVVHDVEEFMFWESASLILVRSFKTWGLPGYMEGKAKCVVPLCSGGMNQSKPMIKGFHTDHRCCQTLCSFPLDSLQRHLSTWLDIYKTKIKHQLINIFIDKSCR